MKTKLLKKAGWPGALLALGLLCLTAIKAQPSVNPWHATSISTNWIGCLVVGKNDDIDQIAQGLHPTAVHQVEIGLRSDGVVIWRNAIQTR